MKISRLYRPDINSSRSSIDVFQRIDNVYPSMRPKINEKTFKYIYNKYTIEESAYPYTFRIDTVTGGRIQQAPDIQLYGMNGYLDSRSLESATKVVIVPKTLDSVIVCYFSLPGSDHKTAVCDVMSAVKSPIEVLYQIPYASLSQFKEVNQAYVQKVSSFLFSTKKQINHGNTQH